MAAASAVAWAALLGLWGGFWRADQRLGAPKPVADAPPAVVAVIPARDEAASIGAVVAAHLQSEYPGAFSMIVVDDSSADGTAACARAAAAGDPRLEVLEAGALPPGWTGKLWAQAQGVATALARTPAPTYLLLCDADIILGRDTLSRLVAKAEAERLALVSLMARLDARGFWAGLLMPAFVFFFQMLYPFRWVNAPHRRTAGAAGGVMLARADALAQLDLPNAIRGALIDDCALAAAIKRGPPPAKIWLGLATGDEALSLRDNRALGVIWRMVARTAYAQLGRAPLAVVGTVMGLALVYLGPPLLALAAWGTAAGWLGLLGSGAMMLAFAPTALAYRKPWAIPLLPLAAAVYGAMTIDSALQHHAGRGGAWKGRVYADPKRAP